MIEINDLVHYQADMMQVLLRAMTHARDSRMPPSEFLQHLAEEAVHHSMTSKIASPEAKALYNSFPEYEHN